MVRESRHSWVGNLPDSMKNDEIADYFSRLVRWLSTCFGLQLIIFLCRALKLLLSSTIAIVT